MQVRNIKPDIRLITSFPKQYERNGDYSKRYCPAKEGSLFCHFIILTQVSDLHSIISCLILSMGKFDYSALSGIQAYVFVINWFVINQ